jgi:nucleoside-diphosphate-sugar epimerase
MQACTCIEQEPGTRRSGNSQPPRATRDLAAARTLEDAMRVFLAGASAALGTPLTRELVSRGHEVLGLTTTEAGATRLSGIGATPVIADALDRDALLRALDGMQADAVIHELTALSKPPMRASGMKMTNRLRIDGSANLLAAAERLGARRFLTQSIVLGYGFHDHGDRLITEDDPFGRPEGKLTDEATAALVSAEQQAFSAPEGIALRYGMLYGGDAASMVPMLRQRKVPVADGGLLGWVHHRDAASATVRALEQGNAGAAYNIVDDRPASWEQVMREMARAGGAPPPRKLPRWLLRLIGPYVTAAGFDTSMRVSNAKAKAELGWQPAFPTYVEGVQAMAQSEGPEPRGFRATPAPRGR